MRAKVRTGPGGGRGGLCHVVYRSSNPKEVATKGFTLRASS